MTKNKVLARLITPIGLVVATAIVLLGTQILIPHGTPTAIVFSALVLGGLSSLVAVGMVLIYRSHRFISFMQPVIGVLGGVFAFDCAVLIKWPWLLALAAGVIVAGATGLLFQLGIVTRFFNAPRLVLTVMSIAAIPVITGLIGQIDNLPIFPPRADRPPDLLTNPHIPVPLENKHFTLGHLPLSFGFVHLFSLGMVLVTLIAFALFFRYSRIGIALRGAAENSDRARMLGISVQVLSMVAWTIAGVLSGIGIILTNATQQALGASNPNETLRLFVIPLAGAVFGGFRNYAVAAWSTVLIFIIRAAIAFRWGSKLGLFDLGLFVAIVVVFIFQQRRGSRSEEIEATSWDSMQEFRAVPREMYEVPGIRYSRWVLIIVGVAALLLLPWVVSGGQTQNAGYLLAVAMAILSLVVLTGWSGQASLGQWAFVAVGAVVGGALTSRLGISFWFAIFIVPIITGIFAFLIGLPALRIRGLFLAIATFAFAVAVEHALFNATYFGWLLPNRIDRPTLLFFNFDDNRSMYYLELLALLVVVVIILTLRRTRAGRLLIGARDNEPNLRAFGVSPVRMRLTAFAISGMICGLAGVLIAHQQRAVVQGDFLALQSLNIFVLAVVGGIGSVVGGLLGAGYFAVLFFLPKTNPILTLFVGPIGTLLILYMIPGGLASVVMGARDSVLRIVAQRRQMVVPSLFADYDPNVAEHKLVPLAEPIPGAGLAAVPADRRYASAQSEMYGKLGRQQEVKKRRDDEDAHAIGAAARAFGGEEAEEILGAQT